MARENLVSGIKLSTVVPASMTGEDKIHHFTNLDLALKLHYITTVHFFGSDAAAGLTIHDFKKPMFQWLQLYYPICGRLRRLHGGGRPYIKCNDSGVRIVEAMSAKTVAEWLADVDDHRLLVHDQPIIAQDFGFTPLVFLQLTKFRCGGLCVGMRWAHILGDAFSALECINMWGKIMANQVVTPQLLPPSTSSIHHHHSPESPPSLSAVKLLESVGDNWLPPTQSKMQTHTLHITHHQLTTLLSRHKHKLHDTTTFQIISALVWKAMAKINATKIVTLCGRTKFDDDSEEAELPSNVHQVIGVVEAQTATQIADADPLEIVELMTEKFVNETELIERKMEEGDGVLDFLMYGSNLTFLNAEGVDVYGLRLQGQRPVLGNISVVGVGERGAVVVALAADGGRVVNIVLPQDELHHLKNELRVNWGIS